MPNVSLTLPVDGLFEALKQIFDPAAARFFMRAIVQSPDGEGNGPAIREGLVRYAYEKFSELGLESYDAWSEGHPQPDWSSWGFEQRQGLLNAMFISKPSSQMDFKRWIELTQAWAARLFTTDMEESWRRQVFQHLCELYAFGKHSIKAIDAESWTSLWTTLDSKWGKDWAGPFFCEKTSDGFLWSSTKNPWILHEVMRYLESSGPISVNDSELSKIWSSLTSHPRYSHIPDVAQRTQALLKQKPGLSPDREEAEAYQRHQAFWQSLEGSPLSWDIFQEKAQEFGLDPVHGRTPWGAPLLLAALTSSYDAFRHLSGGKAIKDAQLLEALRQKDDDGLGLWFYVHPNLHHRRTWTDKLLGIAKEAGGKASLEDLMNWLTSEDERFKAALRRTHAPLKILDAYFTKKPLAEAWSVDNASPQNALGWHDRMPPAKMEEHLLLFGKRLLQDWKSPSWESQADLALRWFDDFSLSPAARAVLTFWRSNHQYARFNGFLFEDCRMRPWDEREKGSGMFYDSTPFYKRQDYVWRYLKSEEGVDFEYNNERAKHAWMMGLLAARMHEFDWSPPNEEDVMAFWGKKLVNLKKQLKNALPNNVFKMRQEIDSIEKHCQAIVPQFSELRGLMLSLSFDNSSENITSPKNKTRF